MMWLLRVRASPRRRTCTAGASVGECSAARARSSSRVVKLSGMVGHLRDPPGGRLVRELGYVSGKGPATTRQAGLDGVDRHTGLLGDLLDRSADEVMQDNDAALLSR